MKSNREVDLCYLPTNNLCKINEVLDDSYFPDNKEDIISQELVTYQKIKGGIKKTTFERKFTKVSHYDCYKTEIFNTK